jgi:hypothetical protein
MVLGVVIAGVLEVKFTLFLENNFYLSTRDSYISRFRCTLILGLVLELATEIIRVATG